MSTITAGQRDYVRREEKLSLKERLKKYYEENADIINSGILFMNGNVSPYLMYRYGMMK